MKYEFTVSHRRYQVMTFLVCLVVSGMVLIVNYLVDPWQYYRRPIWYEPIYLANERYLNPGLARNQDYEIVAIGNSHARNLFPEDFHNILGASGVTLSIDGSGAEEQVIIAEMALSQGKAQRVIWILDPEMYWRGSQSALPRPEIPMYLYKPNWATHWLILANQDTIMGTARVLLGRGERDFGRLFSNWQRFSYGIEEILRDWYTKRDPSYRGHTKDAATVHLSEGLERHLFRVVRNYPDVTFDLVLPPFSQLYLLLLHDRHDGQWEKYLEFRRQVVTNVGSLKQVRIFDLQGREDIIGDWTNYRDLKHYNLRVQHEILHAIMMNNDRLTEINVDAGIERISEMVDILRRDVESSDHPLHRRLWSISD